MYFKRRYVVIREEKIQRFITIRIENIFIYFLSGFIITSNFVKKKLFQNFNIFLCYESRY